jgi:ABC-type enterobactin transport system permease subunit
LHISNFRALASWAVAIGGALAVGGTVYQKLSAPLTSDQQTVVTSTTRVVVVLIPGFPVESIALGALLGFMILMIIRRRKQIGVPHQIGRNIVVTKVFPSGEEPRDGGFP